MFDLAEWPYPADVIDQVHLALDDLAHFQLGSPGAGTVTGGAMYDPRPGADEAPERPSTCEHPERSSPATSTPCQLPLHRPPESAIASNETPFPPSNVGPARYGQCSGGVVNPGLPGGSTQPAWSLSTTSGRIELSIQGDDPALSHNASTAPNRSSVNSACDLFDLDGWPRLLDFCSVDGPVDGPSRTLWQAHACSLGSLLISVRPGVPWLWSRARLRAALTA